MRSYCVSKSTSTATTASVTVYGDSQPESAIEQHHQGSFADLLTTVHTPESTSMPADDRPFAGLRLLAEVSTSQLDPFETLATHRTITFDDEDQEQSASSLSLPDGPLLSNEPSQATDDANPIMEIEEPKPRSDRNLADHNADSTDKWIMYSGDAKRPFQCGYEDCGKIYMTKQGLQKHFVSHAGDSQFRCHTGDCTGAIRYCDRQALARHIYKKHTKERAHACDICPLRFGRRGHLKRHKEQVHSTEKEQKSPPKRKRKADPFEALSTHRTITYDDENQEQSASSLSLPEKLLLSNEPSQAADDANPIMKVEEPHELRFTVLPDNEGGDTEIITTISIPRNQVMASINDHFQRAFLGTAPEIVQTRITENPKLPSDQILADQNADSTDKWIMYSSDHTRPFQCGHEGCGKTYMTKQGLRRHFISHIGDSQFRCYTGDCTGKIRYCDSQALALHIHITHTMERPFKCNMCNKRFSHSDKLRHHKEQVHSPEKEQNTRKEKTTKKEKKSPPKRKRKVDPPFGALVTQRTITFDDEDQGHSASSLSLPDKQLMPNEPSPATDDANPIREVAEPHETGISEVPKHPSDQNLVIQDSDSTDKWIMCSGDKTKSFKYGYKGCGRIYTSKQNLRKHLASHIGGSQFRCYSGDCNGTIRYYDSQALARHIHIKHTFERPFECNICNQRFRRRAHLQRHQQKIHSTEKEKTTPKESKSPPKRKRK